MGGLPLTMWLQIAVSLVGTAIGVCALAVAAQGAAVDPRHTLSWRLSGQASLLIGLCGMAQNAYGSAAILAGEQSAVWAAFLRAAPALNYSRSGVEAVALALLAAAGTRSTRRQRRLRAAGWPALLAGLAAGYAAGWWEGALLAGRHYPNIAAADAAAFAAWAAVLSVIVIRDSADRWLVATLALAAVPLPLNALWLSWLARAGSAWTPRPAGMQLVRLGMGLLALAAAGRRLRLARTGTPVVGVASDPVPARR